MKINIQSLSFRANEKLIDYAKDKIGKLSQYSERIMEAQVTLKVVKAATKNNNICEIKLAIPGKDLFASKRCHSFEEAILKSSEALKQQLLTWKERNQDVNYGEVLATQLRA